MKDPFRMCWEVRVKTSKPLKFSEMQKSEAFMARKSGTFPRNNLSFLLGKYFQ